MPTLPLTSLGNPNPASVASAITGILTLGDVYYVDSGHANALDRTKSSSGSYGRGRSPKYPFATLDYAIGQCTANNNDIIVVSSRHAESVSTAGFITCDVAGVTIIGQGSGNRRPTFSWSATDATWVVSAADVTIRNIICVPSINEVVKMFSVSASGCTFDNVDHVSAATAIETIQFLLTTSAANFLTIKNCRHLQATAAASAQIWIQIVAGANARIVDNEFDILANASATSYCIGVTTAATGVFIARNLICFRGASIVSPISLVTTTTGFISDNRIGMTSTAGTIDNIVLGDTAFKFNNLSIDVAGTASGILTPAVGTHT